MLPSFTSYSVRLRGTRGSVAILLPAAILVAVIGIGAFALDISHNVTVRSELQSATDAAALAGAMDLLKDETKNNAENTAAQVAEANSADGKSISNSTDGCTLITEVSPWDNSTNSGTVQVDGTVTINNMFAKLFGHNTDQIQAHSVAQCWRSVTSIRPNEGFPLMVSLDTTNGNPKPLFQMTVGDKFDVHINSQRYKNGAWTGFKNNNTNANWLTDAIDMILGFKPMVAGHISGAEVGDDLSLGNGVMAQKKLAEGAYEAALTDAKRTIVVPVMLGDPPYNRQRDAVGFITLHVDRVTKNRSGGEVETLHTTIVKNMVKGEGGIPEFPGPPQQENGMQNISAGTVQLIQ